MKLLRPLVLLALATVAPFTARAAEDAAPGLAVGQPAPLRDVRMPGVDGRATAIADVAGKQGTLVIFMCQHCPWVKAWQSRPLEALYAVVYLDALVVKIRDGQAVRNHACYLAIGVNLDGEREVLGIWFQRSEGAKFWLQVLTDLKQRGVADVLVACVDGLTGFPEAIEAVFPQTWVQTCLVHQVRSSLRFVPYRDKRAVAADLKRIYTATDQDAAADELQRFADKWDARYPTISRSWLEHWEQIVPFLAFPPDVRRAVYTTNTIEALNRQVRKIIKTRGQFPTEDAARKLIWLAITRAQAKWRRAYNWNAALAAFKIHFGDRIPDNAI